MLLLITHLVSMWVRVISGHSHTALLYRSPSTPYTGCHAYHRWLSTIYTGFLAYHRWLSTLYTGCHAYHRWRSTLYRLPCLPQVAVTHYAYAVCQQNSSGWVILKFSKSESIWSSNQGASSITREISRSRYHFCRLASFTISFNESTTSSWEFEIISVFVKLVNIALYYFHWYLGNSPK